MRKIRKIRNTAAGFLAMLLITTSLLPVSAFAAEQANGETQETAQETTMTSLSEETSEIASESNAESELPSDDTETHYKLEIDPFTPNGRILVNKVDADDGSPLMGAEFSVYDKDGKLVETKQTDDTGLVGFVLWQGRYTLVETKAPEGYQLDNREHKFELTEEQPQLWMEIENKKIVLNVTKTLIKYDQDTEESLSGAEFEILNRDHERIQTIVSEANGVKLTLPEGKYYIRELKAPEGYELDSEEHELIMQNEKLSTPILIPNKKAVSNVFVSKYDMHGNALPGAVLELYSGEAADGELLESWISDETPHEISLPDGTYTLHEVAAPDGYEVATDITFTVDAEKNEVTVTGCETAADGNVIVMIDEAKPVPEKPTPEEPDKPTPEEPGKPSPKEMTVKLSKQDISGKELPSARMELYSGKTVQGKALESWISGEKPYEIALESGTYTLHEVIAPDGYEIATDITFVVNAEKQEVILSDTGVTAPDNMVVMVDKAKPVPEKEEPEPEKPETPKPTEPETDQPKPTEPEAEQPKPEKPVNPEAPKTGDDTNLTFWYILSAISLIGAVALGGTAIYTQHKGRKDEQK